MFVVAYSLDHFPGVSAIVAPEQRGRLDAAPYFFLAVPRLDRPDIGERAPVVLGEDGRRLGLLERLPEIGRFENFHPEESIAARGVEAWCAARVDQRGVDGNAGPKGSAQREALPGLRPLRDEQSFLGPDAENDALRHVQPPETAGRIVTTSPGDRAVSSPSRSRTLSMFTNT